MVEGVREGGMCADDVKKKVGWFLVQGPTCADREME